MSYTTQVITAQAEFFALETEWQQLLTSSATNEVFQSFSFLATWWKEFRPGELSIISVRDKANNLVALAPLFSEKINEEKNIKMLGCINVSDYLDILITKNGVDELYPILLGAVKNLSWSRLEWCSLPEASPSRTWLKDFFTAHTVSELQQDVCPQIILPDNWEEYLSSLDRKQRHEIRRKERRLQERGYIYEEIVLPSQVDIADFIYLHKQSSKDKRDFWNTTHLEFFRQVLPAIGKQGWLRLFFLKVAEKRVAAMLVFDYNNQFQLYNSGFLLEEFSELSVGSLLTAHTIKRAIEEKRSVYDFLRGDESYKFRYTKHSKPIFDITITRDDPSAK